MKKILLLLTSFILLLSACSKTDKEVALPGIWKEVPQHLKFAGTAHWIKLNADQTFEMALSRFSDMLESEPVPCPNNRIDYVKGTYQRNDGTIIFSGSYCDESFSQIQPNCRGEENYQEHYTLSFRNG